jgi:phosphate transport system permease protein
VNDATAAVTREEEARPATRRGYRPHRVADAIFGSVSRFSTILVLLLLGGVVASLLLGALPALRQFGPDFLVSTAWNPVTNNYGAAVAIVGTLVSSLIALSVGLPLSFGIAFFLTEICPNSLRRPVTTAIELLAAVPSIIYGIWGLFVLAPFMQFHIQPLLIETLGAVPMVGILFAGPPLGIGVLTAGLILGLMVLPFIATIMCDVFLTVPTAYKESAFGLGCTTFEVVWNVVLPYGRSGVVGGVMLGLGRALGETMAVTFVIGNAHQIRASLLAPGSTIASTIANEFTEAVGALYTSSLLALGLILVVITLGVLALSKWLLARARLREGEQA